MTRSSSRLALLIAVSVVVLVGCKRSSHSNTREPSTQTTSDGNPESVNVTPQPDRSYLKSVPPVEAEKHSVPLEQIYFDTFRRTNRLIPFPDSSSKLRDSLRDKIPPIYEPEFESLASADTWLQPTDGVIGYVDGDEAFAYPLRVMNWHEIVSHEVNGVPIVATY